MTKTKLPDNFKPEYHYVRRKITLRPRGMDDRGGERTAPGAPVVTLALWRTGDANDVIYFGVSVHNKHDEYSKSAGRNIALTRLESVVSQRGLHAIKRRRVRLGGSAVRQNLQAQILLSMADANCAIARDWMALRWPPSADGHRAPRGPVAVTAPPDTNRGMPPEHAATTADYTTYAAPTDPLSERVYGEEKKYKETP